MRAARRLGLYLAPTLDRVPASPNPDELNDIVAFIAAQQAHPDRRVSYLGTDAAGIIAELDALKPPWLTTARVLRDGTRITGAVITEWDDDLGRAWIVGPWVRGVGDTWMAAAVALLDAALAELPATVTRYEMSGDIANHRLADLAASQGWTATEPNHVLLADASVVATWPGGDLQPAALRAAARDDIGTIAALHDAEFPDTYASATQLVDGQLDGSRVVLVADDGHGGVAGYAAGEVHDDGEGFIDFVAVDPASRATGVGRQLVVAITRQLLDRSMHGRVRLTVQDHRTPARTFTNDSASGPTERSSPTARGRCNDTSLVGRPALSMPTSTTRTTAALPGPRLAGGRRRAGSVAIRPERSAAGCPETPATRSGGADSA
jgi:GNAT superfamily N-acetyltransferase